MPNSEVNGGAAQLSLLENEEIPRKTSEVLSDRELRNGADEARQSRWLLTPVWTLRDIDE